MKHKHIMILALLSMAVMFTGCSQKKSKLYAADNKMIQSSSVAYDYSYALNDEWNIQIDQEDIKSYSNNIDDTVISFIKLEYDNDKHGVSMQSADIPSLFDGKKINNISFDDLEETSSRTDYHNEFKFRYSKGTSRNKSYQAIYFLSDHIIPSISGEKVANCIYMEYTMQDDRQIEQFLEEIEKTIQYE